VVGTLAANYSIIGSDLPKSHSAYALQQAQISAGQLITGTAIFSLNQKDRPLHVPCDGYMAKLSYLSSTFVNPWDVGEERGWLVNGVAALLHVLRASLEHSKRKLKSEFLLHPHQLSDADDPTHPEAAMAVLTSRKNRDLQLYEDQSEVLKEHMQDNNGKCRIETKKVTRCYRVEDRVEHICNILEKLIDHQTSIAERSGIQVSFRPRRDLDGWDFRDLVTDGGPLFSRVVVLKAIGKGWVDFTRGINAITLFGHGFGDSIQPKRPAIEHCSVWSSVPTGKYYLTAWVSDLKEKMSGKRYTNSSPIQLCRGVIWHVKRKAFQRCPCAADGGHHDPSTPCKCYFQQLSERRSARSPKLISMIEQQSYSVRVRTFTGDGEIPGLLRKATLYKTQKTFQPPQ
jgi:hypothetical protein